ncbi:MAG: 4a-hydroxytetrahydrobiopterin dehydratase [Bacteroidota bacterium]
MNWKEENNKLKKTVELKDFKAALNFVNEIGVIAESKQHHPDILIHEYNKVQITLTTHDEGKVTAKDHDVAEAIDTLKSSN